MPNKKMCVCDLQEMVILREAMFPPLMCAAARKGNIESLEQLRESGAVITMGDYDSR